MKSDNSTSALNKTHPTHFIYGYMASDMVNDLSDSERGNPLQPHGLLFPISMSGQVRVFNVHIQNKLL